MKLLSGDGRPTPYGVRWQSEASTPLSLPRSIDDPLTFSPPYLKQSGVALALPAALHSASATPVPHGRTGVAWLDVQPVEPQLVTAGVS